MHLEHHYFNSIADVHHDFVNLDETAKFPLAMTKPEALELTGAYLSQTLQVRNGKALKLITDYF